MASLRLEAETQTVEDLVRLVTRGIVRVPAFQRGLRWEGEDVVALFDSIYRGYPIGSILLRRGRAEAARIQVGPFAVDAPETEAALWVVDGQQRLTALAAGLSRPVPLPKTPDDPWVVYFDAASQEFKRPSGDDGHVPSTWVPVAQLLDASALSEWVFQWQHAGDPVLRAAVFQAGSLIRQYRIPLYVVEADDEQKLRDIFYRINNFGKSLEWSEVHDALFGHRGVHPSTLKELAVELQKLGMGQPEEETLLSCLVAFKGLDVTRNITEHYRKDAKVLAGAVQESLPALRRVLSFLKLHAEIPHLRLLPRSIPLVVLTRFFALFPEPQARTLSLLVRWTWRLLLGGSGPYDERTLLRRGVAAIQGADEEKSVQELLSLVPRERRDPYTVPRRFDARAADSRIALVGMASLGPLDLNGAPIDVAALIEQHDVADIEAFLSERKLAVENAVNCLGERLAAWSRSDRPTIHYLLEQAEIEA